MKSTLSRSVRVTPRTEPEPDTSGTPPTEPSSASTYTIWTAVLDTGEIRQVKLPGDGRISYGGSIRGTTQVRFYRNQTTKFYDAVVSGVTDVYSQRVEVEDMGKTTAAKAAETAREAWEAKRATEAAKYLADKMIAGTYGSAAIEAWGTVGEDDDEEEPVAL